MTNTVDGSEDGDIYCFKQGQTHSSDRVMLQEQMKVTNYVEKNLAIADEDYIIEAGPIDMQINVDDELDDFLDIME